MYMPRLSLYRPEKSKDYNFLDKIVYEQFTVGGTDLLIHKYIGPKSPDSDDATVDQPQYDIIKETNIQDLLFLENRDRKYEKDVYTVRGHYNVADLDFDLSQFGLFLSNDTIILTVHINSSVNTMGRKLMIGDVIELPHLIDEYAANDYDIALKRFYVIDEVSRAAEGFSQTWYPHLYRIKCKQIYDGQEYKDILDLPATENSNKTLRDVLSTFEREMQINNAVVAQADENAKKSGYSTQQFYTVQVDENGEVSILSVDMDDIDASEGVTADMVFETPLRSGYLGYLVGDGIPPNGAPFGVGSGFPAESAQGDYFLRNDFLPNRLFRFDGNSWQKVEDNVRAVLSHTDQKNTLLGTFINNTTVNTISGENVTERQALSKALRAKADN
tara:strand:- start:1851 stop:3011 length:1161 start_codon:yes stop_codon:yes gene_type:complete